jgi:hypothetical protein
MLPLTATGISYYDDIGNVTTSISTLSPTPKQFILRPRYPLYGGWQTSFNVSYSVPQRTLSYQSAPLPSQFSSTSSPVTRTFFFSDDLNELKAGHVAHNRAYGFAVQFSPSMQHAAAEECVLRIALPEGARNVVAHSDIGELTKDEVESLTFSTLDYFGRRTIAFRRHNVLNSAAFGTVIVLYDLPFVYRIHKLFILCCLFLLALICWKIITSSIRWFQRGSLYAPLPRDKRLPTAAVAIVPHQKLS